MIFLSLCFVSNKLELPMALKVVFMKSREQRQMAILNGFIGLSLV